MLTNGQSFVGVIFVFYMKPIYTCEIMKHVNHFFVFSVFHFPHGNNLTHTHSYYSDFNFQTELVVRFK